MKISPSPSLRRLLPLITDDLKLILPRGRSSIQLTPDDAFDIGRRLTRQATYVDPELIIDRPKRRSNRSK